MCTLKGVIQMKYKTRLSLFLILTALLHIAPVSVSAAELFSDSFESADVLKTNANGFSWATNSVKVSLVTSTHEVWSGASSINRTKDNALDFPGGNWVPKSGDYSMRYRYPAGEAWSEQRFDLGVPERDIWISYWVRVPVNFSYGPSGSPNKFFSLWSDGYSSKGEGSTVWLGFHRKNVADATIGFAYSDGGYKTSNAYTQNVAFITTADRGRWMHMVMHYRNESDPGVSDGLAETYRRWDGETNYTKLHYVPNLPLRVSAGGPNGFKAGYILGWANAAYTQDTEWLLDDFSVSNSAPDYILTGINPPNAPTNLTIER